VLAPVKENPPEEHSRHVVAWLCGENVPGKQSRHSLLCSYLPGRHAVHSAEDWTPDTRLYVPFGQALQSPAFDL
jgi:hypothetical protein